MGVKFNFIPVLLCLLASPVSARTLTLGSTAGKVTVNSRRVRAKQAIREGDLLVTGGYHNRRQSKAVILFDYRQGIGLIGPRSSIKVTKLRWNRGGAVTHFLVNRGAMWASLRKFNSPYSQVVFQYKDGPTQIIRGTDFGISYNGRKGAIITKSGSVAVFDGKTSTAIGPGEGVLIHPNGTLSMALPATQRLSHNEFRIDRRGAYWQVSGRVVNRHCVLDHCIFEPVSYPSVRIFGRQINVNCFGFFSYKTKPPTPSNSLNIEISHNNQKSIIMVSPKGLLPKHP